MIQPRMPQGPAAQNPLETIFPSIDPIELTGSLRQIGTLDLSAIPSGEIKKAIFEDSTGRKWLEKRVLNGDEPAREFVGHHLLALLKDCGVVSPRIKTHKGVSGYLSEYFEGMEDLRGSDPRYGIRFYGKFKEVSDLQMQHLVMCMINGDYDRNFFNYGFTGEDLIVLDQAGGKKEPIEKSLEHMGAALFISGMLNDESRRQIAFYQKGIDIAKAAVESGYLRDVIDKTHISNSDKTRILNDIKQRLIKIGDTLKSVFIAYEKQQERYNKEGQQKAAKP